jgi:hypothetical protein
MLKSDMDGFSYAGMMTEMKTASNPDPVKGMVHIGYDGTAKSTSCCGSTTSGAGPLRSRPAGSDTMVWTGDQNVMGEKATARDTFVKKSDTEYTHKFELQMKGQWSPIVDETCKKAGAVKK